MKRYKFKVKPKHKDGALDFPMDMLRYDRCYPVTLEDARAIGVAARAVLFVIHRGRKPYKGTIELQSNDRQPSDKAWESHGWLVCSCESFRQ
jgi:hypothetical protein